MQVTQTLNFSFSDSLTDTGEPLPITSADFSALDITNNSGKTISYSTNGGSTWTDLADAGTLSFGYGLKANYLFRKATPGWLSIDATVTHPGSEPAQFKMVSGAVNSLTDPTGTKAYGFAMLPVDVNGKVCAAVASVAAANSAAAAAATSTAIATATPAAAPAGGTGAAAGGWDTAANRDAAITTINGLRDVAVELKTDHDALLADVADIRTKYADAVTLANETKAQLNALLTELRAKNILAA